MSFDKEGKEGKDKREGFAVYLSKEREKGSNYGYSNVREALMEMLEDYDYEDAEDFEVLKNEETIDYEEYRKSRLKRDVRDQD